MKRIIISLSIVGAVAAAVVVGTTAFFSDTETSTGNTFTAGTLDLKVESTCHYWQNNGNNGYQDVGCENFGNWTETDLGPAYKFFNFSDVKPGDKGENTISLKPVNNDAYVCAYVMNLMNDDNGLTEPESIVDTTDGVGNGELQNNIYMTVWRDTNCNNILDDTEKQNGILAKDVPIDNNNGAWSLGQIAGNTRSCLGVAWNVPTTVGNVIQSDKVSADIMFYAEQVRNNPNFSCPTVERITKTFQFGDGGWAGWSCPAGKTAIGGGIDSHTATVGGNGLAIPGATIDGSTYPTFPHYKYPAGETGYVVHDLQDGQGNNITFHVDCL